MAQNTAQLTRLIGERVRALAIIARTRRGNVSLHELAEDYGLDLIATIHREDRPGLRQFGVFLKGVWAKVTADRANAALRPSLRELLRFGPFPYPVVLFFYTMEDGEGWYTWATEPHITREGDYELRANEDASCRRLDDDAVDEIIDRVDAWYDAFFAKTSKETPRMRKK